MGAQQIVQHFQQGAVLQPVQHHDRRVRMVAHHPQGGPGLRAQVPWPSGPRPGSRTESSHGIRDRQASSATSAGTRPARPAPGPGPAPAGDAGPGRRPWPPGRPRFPPARPGAARESGPVAAGQEPEGGQAPGQGPGHRRAGRVQVRFQAPDQFSHHPFQQVAGGFPGSAGPGRRPRALPSRPPPRPSRTAGVAQPLLPLQDQHPFHGDGRAEAEHQGFQVGEFPGAAAQGAPRRGGPLRRLRPGAFPGLGARRRRAVPPQLGEERFRPPGRGAQDPRRQHLPGLDPHRFRGRHPRRAGPGQGRRDPGPQVPAASGVGPRPDPGQGHPAQLLEEPCLVLVAAQVAGARIQGLGPGEPVQELILENIKNRGRRAGVPELQQPAGAVAFAAHHPPGAPRDRAAGRDQAGFRRIPVGPQAPPGLHHAPGAQWSIRPPRAHTHMAGILAPLAELAPPGVLVPGTNAPVPVDLTVPSALRAPVPCGQGNTEPHFLFDKKAALSKISAMAKRWGLGSKVLDFCWSDRGGHWIMRTTRSPENTHASL